MWVEVHGLSNNICTLGSITMHKAHFVHCIEKLAVRGLEAVNFGNSTRNNNAHNVGHIVFFYSLGYGLKNYLRLFFSKFLCLLNLLSCHYNFTYTKLFFTA